MTRLVPKQYALPDKQKINLKTGWPSTQLLPASALLSAAQNVLTNASVYSPALLYGADEGYTPVREELAKWLTSFYGDAVGKYAKSVNSSQAPPTPDSSRIVISGGASQSLGCILSELTDPAYTRHAWIMAPGYFMGFKIFEDAPLKMRAVPEGESIDWLRKEMKLVEEKRREQSENSDAQSMPVSIPVRFSNVQDTC